MAQDERPPQISLGRQRPDFQDRAVHVAGHQPARLALGIVERIEL
jgi:hypothetical protein